jgi:hypothetical protein
MVYSMMITLIFCAFIFVLYIGGYGWILRRISNEVQPARCELAEIGESLLAQELDDPARQLYVQWCLDHAFSPWPMLLAALTVPFLFLKFIIVGGGQDSNYNDPKLTKMTWLFLLSSFAANPIFGIVYGIEMLLIGLALLIRGGLPLVIRMVAATMRIEVISFRTDTRRHA